MASKHTHIADASALIAYFKNEPGADIFAGLLGDEQNIFAIHSVNLCEVYYGYLRSDGPSIADEAWDRAEKILAMIERFDMQFMKRVGRWKVNCGLGLADAFAAATAEEFACCLVTTDHAHFDPIDARKTIQVAWLR